MPIESFSLEKIASLPAVGAKGLFLACSIAKEKEGCDALFPLLDFCAKTQDGKAVPDPQLLRSCLEAYCEPEQILKVSDAVEAAMLNASQSGKILDERRKFDLSEFLVEAHRQGRHEAAKALMGFARSSCSLAKTPKGAPVCPLTYAAEAGDGAFFRALLEKKEINEAFGSVLRKERCYGNELPEFLAARLREPDIWKSPVLPEAILAKPMEQVHPQIIALMLTHHEGCDEKAARAWGWANLAAYLLEEGRSEPVELIAELSAANDELASRLAAEIPAQKRLFKSLTESGYYFSAQTLYSAAGPKTRDAVWAALGAAPVANFAKYKQSSASSAYYRGEFREAFASVCSDCEKSKDYRMLTAFADAVSLRSLNEAFSDSKPWCLRACEELGSAGYVPLLLQMKAKDSVEFEKAFKSEGWIIEHDGMRKKGDALASAIVQGKTDTARELLRAFPDASKARAKETLRYLKKKGAGETQAVALGAFEQLLFEESLAARDAQAGKPAPSKRKGL